MSSRRGAFWISFVVLFLICPTFVEVMVAGPELAVQLRILPLGLVSILTTPLEPIYRAYTIPNAIIHLLFPLAGSWAIVALANRYFARPCAASLSENLWKSAETRVMIGLERRVTTALRFW